MSQEELQLLFELVNKAKNLLSTNPEYNADRVEPSIPEFVSIEINNDSYKLSGIIPSPYGDHEYFTVVI